MKTIDVTPSWSEILPVLLVLLESGPFESKAFARKELKRMAALADSYVKIQRPQDEFGEN